METNPPLRVGVLVAGQQGPAWVEETLRRLVTSSHARVEVVVRTSAGNGAPVRAPDGFGPFQHLAHRVDDRLFRPRPDAFRRCSLDSPLLPDSPLVLDGVEGWGPVAERLGSLDLDVVLELGASWPEGEDVDGAARFGVWSVGPKGEEGWAGSREVLAGRPVTTVIVRSRGGKIGAPRILAVAHVATDPLSPKRNRNQYHWKAAGLVPSTLRRLRREGTSTFFEGRSVEAGLDGRPSGDDVGGNGTMGPLLRLVGRKVGATIRRRLFREPWVLYCGWGSRRDGWCPPHPLLPLIPPPDRFWADPHVVAHDGRYHVFVEEYPFATRRGHISVLEIDRDGGAGSARTVLKDGDHLSYPFVFRHEGRFYMIPETLARRRIELYRCVSFPDEWTLERILVDDVDAVDATPVRWGRRWWLFANVRDHPGTSVLDDLHLFSSDDLLGGDWVPHPANPIVSDVRRARPAGALFEVEGALYRPGQRCVPRYGSAIVIHRVVTLTETAYDEEPVDVIEPGWERRLDGTHTLSFEGDLTVLDGRLRCWRWW